MAKQLSLILGAMVIVFSLTLIAGGAISVFYLPHNVNYDLSTKSMLSWCGGLIMLVGLAGFLAGLVGILGSAVLKASEIQEESQSPQPVDPPNINIE